MKETKVEGMMTEEDKSMNYLQKEGFELEGVWWAREGGGAVNLIHDFYPKSWNN